MARTIIMATALALFAGSATAQVGNSDCSPRESVIEKLAENYGESRQSIGLAANNSLVEVYASEITGTWTIAITTADGVMCFIATGKEFENLSEPSGVEG